MAKTTTATHAPYAFTDKVVSLYDDGLQRAGIGVELMGNRVLAAKYMRPEKTKGGIILTDKSKDEDKWQGKVGMIVAMGPSAFVEDGEKWFGGKIFKVGDWIMYRNSAGTDMEVNGVQCKQLGDADIIGRIDDPTRIW